MPPTRLTPADRMWAGLLTAGAVYETWTLYARRTDATASQTTRRWWRTDTRTGRLAFLAALYGATTWYAGHILRWWR